MDYTRVFIATFTSFAASSWKQQRMVQSNAPCFKVPGSKATGSLGLPGFLQESA